MHRRRCVTAAAIVAIAIAVTAYAQTALTEASFEAATIKRNLSTAGGWTLNPRPNGQFLALNARIVDLLQAGFLLQPDQLGELPSWTMNERYDIVAKLDPSIASHDQPPNPPKTRTCSPR